MYKKSFKNLYGQSDTTGGSVDPQFGQSWVDHILDGSENGFGRIRLLPLRRRRRRRLLRRRSRNVTWIRTTTTTRARGRRCSNPAGTYRLRRTVQPQRTNGSAESGSGNDPPARHPMNPMSSRRDRSYETFLTLPSGTYSTGIFVSISVNSLRLRRFKLIKQTESPTSYLNRRG